jgi:Fe-S oxidoreductase
MFYPEKWTLCGECLVKCPYLAYSEEKAKQEFKNLIDGKASPVTAECITCAACNMICPEGANPFDLINDRQEETGTFKINPQTLSMFQTSAKMRSKIKPGEPGKPAINICVVDLIPGAIEGELFKGLTILRGGDYFCYFGWIHAALPSLVKENAQKFVDNLANTGAKEIICYHDDCYAMLTNKVKEYGISVPFKATHIIEYLRDYVKAHQDQITKLNMKIAYQQPCASRYAFEKDAILDDLFKLIGVERVKRKYDRVNALCCSGVMATMLNVPKETMDAWRMKNIMDAKEHGAEAMVFLCPMCATVLRNRSKFQGLEPYMLSNLVRLALGEELKQGSAGIVYK